MFLTRGSRRQALVTAAAAAAVLAAAFFFRQTAFWAPHTDPVELAYTSLAMKMGTYPGLSGYHPQNVQLRRTQVPRVDGSGPPIPIVSPAETLRSAGGSFDDWPHDLDPNPFYFKPPFFPALLTYSHHQALGAKFAFYPLLSANPSTGPIADKSKAVREVQAWAVSVPLFSGLLAVLLTFMIGRRVFGSTAGVLAGLGVALHPIGILTSTRIWPEMTMTASLLGAFFLFHRFLASRNWAGCVLAGASYALALLTDSSAIFFLPAFWVWAWMGRDSSARFFRGAFLNPFFLSFAAGSALLYKTWWDYVAKNLGSFPFKLSADRGIAPIAMTPDFLTGAVQIIFYVLLAAAAVTFVMRGLRRTEALSREVCVCWIFIASWGVSRCVFAWGAPWDSRALATVLPFAALLAGEFAARAFALKVGERKRAA